MDHDDVRRAALALEGVEERDHHGFPSFRARTIFATLPDQETLRVMLPEGQIREAVTEFPDWTAESWWGKRLAALGVSLADADAAVVAEWLQDAHRAHG